MNHLGLDFSFFEYSFNPKTVDRQLVTESLVKSGFAMRTHHVTNPVSIWSQNLSVLSVRETEDVDYPGISGLGFLAPQSVIDDLGATYDHECSTYLRGDTNGNRILLFSSEEITNENNVLGQEYQVVDMHTRKNPGFNHVMGLVFNGPMTSAQMDFYQALGFKFTKSGSRYNILVSNNKRFSIIIDKQAKVSEGIQSVIFQSDDVFNSTAHLVANGVYPDEFDLSDLDDVKFDNLSHKIRGYNCIAHGNSESYSIENMVSGILPNTDFIFKTKRQQVGISEKSLEYFYGNRKIHQEE